MRCWSSCAPIPSSNSSTIATEQLEELRRLRPPPDPELVAEPCRWAYYPWRRTVVAVLGPRAFRAVRLDRNRNMITADEQTRLGALRIGVVGLSVGHVIAHTLAAQGLCGELRLADFDRIELSNLNRVPATVLDLGLNKAEVAARRIAELDPYLPVRVSGRRADRRHRRRVSRRTGYRCRGMRFVGHEGHRCGSVPAPVGFRC